MQTIEKPCEKPYTMRNLKMQWSKGTGIAVSLAPFFQREWF